MSSAGTIVKKRQILGLDLLRFAAALLVMWYHVVYGSWTFLARFSRQIGFDFSSLRELRPYSQFGWIGVEIFFVISGFVIAFTAETSSPPQFLESRVLRLVPGVWVCATIAAIFLLALHNPDPILSLYLRSVLFFPVSPYISSAYWTLTIEICFYAVVFFVLLANKFERLVQVATAIGIASSVFWAAWLAVNYLSPHSKSALLLDRFAFTRIAQLLLIEHGCFFAVGALLWAALMKQATRNRIFWISTFTLAGVIQIMGEGSRLAVQDLFVPAAIWLSSLVLLVFSVRRNDGLASLGRGFASWTRKLGLATYPLYLIHFPVAVWLAGYLHSRGLPWSLALPATMLATIALAIAITLYPERMLRAALRRLGSVLGPFWKRVQQPA